MANPEHLEILGQGWLNGRKPDLYQGTTSSRSVTALPDDGFSRCGQGLKPTAFKGLYGTAEAVP